MVQVSKIVKRLRQFQTKAETILWEEIRCNKLYVVDFCCKRKKIVIEVDGRNHGSIKEQDNFRDEQLTRKGFIVLRFANENLFDDICGVIDKVKEIINNRSK